MTRPDLRELPFTIASGTALSGIVDVDFGYVPVGVNIPSAWTAADLTFTGSNSLAGPFNVIRDLAGVPLRVAGVTASSGVTITGLDMICFRYIKVHSSAAAPAITDVNQGADRVMSLIVRSS